MADITTGLKGYWKLDEGSGTTATDSSGNSNTGTLTNSPTFSSTKKFGNYSMQFGGGTSNTYIDIGAPSSLDLSGVNKFTLSAWVYGLSSNYNCGIITEAYTPTSHTVQYELGLSMDGAYDSTRRPAVGFYDDAQGGWYVVRDTSDLELNKWVHIVGTWDGTYLRIYVDGVLKNTSASISATLPSSSVDKYMIGRRHDEYESTFTFDGYVDDARIYNRALSDSEVLALYQYSPDTINTNKGFFAY